MSGLTFQYPEAAALAVLAAMAWWLLLRAGRARWWRAAVLALLVLAATGPAVERHQRGMDVIVVLDRSASMGDARDRQAELLGLLAEQRRTGDRLGLVLVADGTAMVHAPREGGGVPELGRVSLEVEASDLRAGLELAESLTTPGQPTRILLHSDGEATGPSPRPVAARLAAAGVPIDVLPVERAPYADAAVARVQLPGELRRGESFIGSVTFVGDDDERRAYRITRDGQVVSEGVVSLGGGRPIVVTFADRPPEPGITPYVVTLDATADRRPANNQARAALRVVAGERALVVGGDGAPGHVARAIAAAGFEVATLAEGPVTLAALLGADVLVLDQVPADRLGLQAMREIERWVTHFGGGLIMTGGRRSFGTGGYHKSPVERVLPVTLEVRDEQRQLAVAVAVTLDRSGSMQEPVAGGRTKMDLANSGAAAVIELLGPHDEIAVHAVDTSAHVIVEMTRAIDAQALLSKVRGIRSAGGGIFVYEALEAAGAEVLKSTNGTRHIVLFADAADAEQPGAYRTLVGDLRAAGVTISVIGLGTVGDPDAALLSEIAAQGGGRATFTEAAEDLPRLFAQETVLISRSAWAQREVQLVRRPALFTTVAPSPALRGAWPAVHGYNVTHPRPRSQVLALAPGDPEAPAIAAWRAGTGRAVAIAFDPDDERNTTLLAWDGYVPLLSSLARWAAGAKESQPGALYARRSGRTVVLELELDPDRAAEATAHGAPSLSVTRPGAAREPTTHVMRPIDRGRYQAELTLQEEGILIGAAVLPGGDGATGTAIVGPVVWLPYGPEAEPRAGRPGGRLLRQLASATGGVRRASVAGVFDSEPRRRESTSVAGWLLALALLLLVVEVAVRRLALALPRRLRWPAARLWRTRSRRARRRRAPIVAPAADEHPLPAPETAPNAATEPAPEPAPRPEPTAADPPPAESGLGAALEELRRRGR